MSSPAFTGALLLGWSGGGFIGVGDPYLFMTIAAVVVGGTSLAGGSGRIFGTLIGAFIISVIQNGMNLLGIESYTQQVVLGGVIVGAVLLDKLRTGATLSALTATGFDPSPPGSPGPGEQDIINDRASTTALDRIIRRMFLIVFPFRVFARCGPVS